MRQILLAVACMTLLEANGMVCRALCRQDGYDTGSYVENGNKCLCSNEVEFEVVTEKRITIKPTGKKTLPYVPNIMPPAARLWNEGS